MPVPTLEDESNAASTTPAPTNGTMQSQTGNTPGATTGLRNYRRELQYHSSILDIRSQLHGIARPQQNAVMSSLVPGRVMTIHHDEGDRVSAGDILVSLDDRMQAGIQDHLLATSRAYWSLVMMRGDFIQKVTSWNRAKLIADEMETHLDIDVSPLDV